MSPRTPPPSGPPTMEDVQRHCQRVRSAGSPNARARTRLVEEYRRLAEALGVTPEETPTGLDLQRASAALLRAAALSEAAATRRPR
ncbi:MAG TPA: hypothetical protein VNT51_05505 [Miltoncostaeaceae bacterium]|nr:hypothetical protein [Miltoncostaeaceae bacterium]